MTTGNGTGQNRTSDFAAGFSNGTRTALFNLSALLERELVEPFQRNYHELVDQARHRLAGAD